MCLRVDVLLSCMSKVGESQKKVSQHLTKKPPNEVMFGDERMVSG